ncbi:hypothetical protein K439DRAFT_1657690 [Ramaria rubella]|nr:hypothetical protein K439DRAFT_1657690 [Ramaria rubella]
MAQSGGNRARFFAQPNGNNDVITFNSDTSGDEGIVSKLSSKVESIIPEPNVTAMDNNSNGAMIALISKNQTPSHLPSNSQDEIIAQGTRTIETETLFKTTREKSGRLNVSGLVKRKDSGANSIKLISQTATIKEVPESEGFGTRSPGQFSGTKVISKNNVSSLPRSPLPPQSSDQTYSTSIMPPSNQLVSAKMPRHNIDIPQEDMSKMPHSSHTDKFDENSSRLSIHSDDSIKSLTTAFNRKHSTSSKPSIRYASPSLQLRNRGGRIESSRSNSEQTLAAFSRVAEARSRMIESHNYSDDDVDEATYQDPQIYAGSMRELQQQGFFEQRGEKRLNEQTGDDLSEARGKRARTETYETLSNRSINSPMSQSLEPDSGENQPNFSQRALPGPPADHHRDDVRQDPQLRGFLGHDVDDYLVSHTDRYETAKKRWSDCSREEWERGADELVDKFAKVFDFVKEHVKRKVTLYAALHVKIDDHQKDREKTADMLKTAKSKLVAKTGIVVDEG